MISFDYLAQIIFISSFAAMFVFAVKKIPALVVLPNISPLNGRISLPKQAKLKILKYFSSLSFPSHLFLQKLLSKIKILALKTERKSEHYLQVLRQKSKNKKKAANDDYWQKLKNLK